MQSAAGGHTQLPLCCMVPVLRADAVQNTASFPSVSRFFCHVAQVRTCFFMSFRWKPGIEPDSHSSASTVVVTSCYH